MSKLISRCLRVEGMSCTACERRIERELAKLPGVRTVSAQWARERVTIRYDASLLAEARLTEALAGLGYTVLGAEESTHTARESADNESNTAIEPLGDNNNLWTAANLAARKDKTIAAGLMRKDKTTAEGLTRVNRGTHLGSVRPTRQHLRRYGYYLGVLLLSLGLWSLLNQSTVFAVLTPRSSDISGASLGVLFVIGLLTSLHCVSMCGSLQLNSCLKGEESHKCNENSGSGVCSTGGRGVCSTGGRGVCSTGGRGGSGAYSTGSRGRSGVCTGCSKAHTVSWLGMGMCSMLSRQLEYQLGRVLAYMLAGALAGGVAQSVNILGTFIGGFLPLMPAPGFDMQGVFKMAIGLWMLWTGMRLAGFPLPKLRLPQLPGMRGLKYLGRRPLSAGMLNGLMPCGPLQAMWLYAFASGSPLSGALSMLSFSLGTLPLLLIFGWSAAALGQRFAGRAMRMAAVLLMVFGLSMMSQGAALGGWLPAGLTGRLTQTAVRGRMEDGVLRIDTRLEPGRYPDIQVRQNVPVEWHVKVDEADLNGCNELLQIPGLGLSHQFTVGDNVIRFTPTESGSLSYSCWMGMIRGEIKVEPE